MNKICELLLISMLMTNRHANQLLLWPQIADWCRETWMGEHASPQLRNAWELCRNDLAGDHS